jgi:hypothetical protein
VGMWATKGGKKIIVGNLLSVVGNVALIFIVFA